MSAARTSGAAVSPLLAIIFLLVGCASAPPAADPDIAHDDLVLEPVARLTRHSRGVVKRVKYVETESGYQILYDKELRPPEGVLLVDCETTQQLGVWLHIVSPAAPDRDLSRYGGIRSKVPNVTAEWRHSSWPDARDSVLEVHRVTPGYRFDITYNLKQHDKIDGQVTLNVYYVDKGVYSTAFELRGCR